MSTTYDENANGQMLQIQQPSAPTTSNGFWNFIKNNKLLVSIVIIVIIVLIWWFCIKRNKGKVSGSNGNGGIQVTRSRTSFGGPF
jgi:plastocyanin domain-containing protein